MFCKLLSTVVSFIAILCSTSVFVILVFNWIGLHLFRIVSSIHGHNSLDKFLFNRNGFQRYQISLQFDGLKTH